jgi:hypothetical protein
MLWVIFRERATGYLKCFFVPIGDFNTFKDGAFAEGFQFVWVFDAEGVKEILADDTESQQTSADVVADDIEEKASNPLFVVLAKSHLYVGYSMATIQENNLLEHTKIVESDGGRVVATYPMQEAFNLIAARAVQLHANEVTAYRYELI